MKRLLLLLLTSATLTVAAQDDPQSIARSFAQKGDYENAILVLTRALQGDPKNLDLQKELVLVHYYKRDFSKALEGIKVLLEGEPDVSTYQIAGNVYKALEDAKEAEKLYKRALRKYPNSGPLLSEYGELLWARKDFDAIKQWEEGIRVDPGFSGNYYNAAMHYHYTQDRVWSLIYGEIFVNMESRTERGLAMRTMLLKAYKDKLFATVEKGKEKDATPASDFGRQWLGTMQKSASLINRGVTVDALAAVRARFILDWFHSPAARQYPHRLLDLQQQLLREGMWDAYNQWLFGATENLAAYEAWTRTHGEEHAKFSAFQRNRVFRLPAGQYYGKG